VEKVIIPFNKIGLRRWTIFYGVTASFSGLISIAMAVLSLYLAWNGQWSLFLLYLVGCIFMSFLTVYVVQEWLFLVRQTKENSPAFVVTETGIEDYASAYRAGPLSWDEIERMYPAVLEPRLFTHRLLKKFPHRRSRVLCIRLKNKGAFLNRLPRLRSWSASIDSLTGGGRWVVVPERLLSSSVDEVMRQLNRFYIARVRGHHIDQSSSMDWQI
jgi:hypothetical protein